MNSELDIKKFVHDLSITGIHYRCMGETKLSSLILKAVEIIKHQHTELQTLKISVIKEFAERLKKENIFGHQGLISAMSVDALVSKIESELK